MNIHHKIFICFLSIFLAVDIGSFSDAKEKHNDLANKKIAMIVASHNFQDNELFVPLTFFTEKGANVEIASSTVEKVKGMLGKSITPDILFSDINPSNYDAIILVGGSGAAQYFHDKNIHRLIKKALSQDKIIAAICIAPMTLANAGILETKRATVWPGMADDISQKCNIYTGKDVEIDGNIITANGPKSALKFAQAIAEKLTQ